MSSRGRPRVERAIGTVRVRAFPRTVPPFLALASSWLLLASVILGCGYERAPAFSSAPDNVSRYCSRKTVTSDGAIEPPRSAITAFT